MKILAISGSARRKSTNLALLIQIKSIVPEGVSMNISHEIDSLPIFSPDKEEQQTPKNVTDFIDNVSNSDGIIIASPEYVRAIPGGLKNAIDWLVSREAIIAKPIILVHASHRGDDMLASLRLVLSTVSSRFNRDIFARFPLMSKTPDEIRKILTSPEAQKELFMLINDFTNYIDKSDA
ncbi:NADPH-dependent FMN reductase [Lentilitoribacter sp. EG35]|jgi:NAD(P)H-dependent FMN reductase|uniref:NADPH-dependent FMN reductase n=1 Tax=Lentilitoribacter sp. EG35 TaxID=3234192 RepID=UPI0034608025